MTYFFENPRWMDTQKIGVRLSTENGTLSCNLKFYDGQVYEVFSKLGQHNTVNVLPRKTVILKDNRKCRELPYIHMFNNQFLKTIQEKCPKPCRQKNYEKDCEGANDEFQNLAVCKNASDEQCYIATKVESREQ